MITNMEKSASSEKSVSAEVLAAQKPEPKTEKAPLANVGEWVEYNPGTGVVRPAMITHADEETGLVSLMVVYKGHIDFVGEVANDHHETSAETKNKGRA